VIEPSASFALLPGESDMLTFPTAKDASQAFDSLGCEDGLRLLRAALRQFGRQWNGLARLPDKDPRLRFTMRHQTDIPRQVGLAGSSAIIIAAVRALMSWFDVQIEPAVLAELALDAEVEDLGITAGPMDRVIQAYEGVMLMDLREPRSAASYRRFSPSILPPLFLAWDPRGGESSGIAHGDLKARWQRGDPEVHEIMRGFRDLVDEGVEVLETGSSSRWSDTAPFRQLVNRNFEMRSRIFHISDRDRQMVAIASSHDAAAKLTGSGGAVIGVPAREADLEAIESSYDAAGFRMIRPQPIPAKEQPVSE
jgi:glucuronokinase